MNVFLGESIDPGAYRRLAEHMNIVEDLKHPEELDAIIVRRKQITRDIIERASRCRLIAMHGVGLDTIDLQAAEEYKIPVVNVPGESAQSVAELAVAYFLALSRKMKMAEYGLREGRYSGFGPDELIGTEIHGKTVGLIGYGNIGKRVAAIMKEGFQCRILVYTPNFTERRAAECQVERAESAKEIFARADYVSIGVPLTPQTKDMIGTDVFEKANPKLILVDTSRGGIVNENALLHALINRQIAGAGLDVSEKEPMDPKNPLLYLENFMATPHIGASTADAKRRVGDIVVTNVLCACGIEEME